MKMKKSFYKSIKEKDLEDFHLFRNGTLTQNDYYVEYIDQDNLQIRKFFPADFILINEKTKKVFNFISKKTFYE